MNEKLLKIARNLRTQDNRGTADPMFCVQVKERLVTDPECNVDGHGYYDSERVCSYEDGEEYEKFNLMDEYDLPDHIRKCYYQEVWKTVATCFTEAGCEEHLRINGHNYRGYYGTRIYAESFWRNPEMLIIREFLMGLDDKPLSPATPEDKL